jgi:hypothetical protein
MSQHMSLLRHPDYEPTHVTTQTPWLWANTCIYLDTLTMSQHMSLLTYHPDYEPTHVTTQTPWLWANTCHYSDTMTMSQHMSLLRHMILTEPTHVTTQTHYPDYEPTHVTTQTHYPDYEPTSLCSNLAPWWCKKQEIPILLSLLWQNLDQTNDIQQSKRVCSPLHTWDSFFSMFYAFRLYSETCVIQHPSFPTSCDFRQEFQVPKYFLNILC